MDATPSLIPTLDLEHIQPDRPVKLIIATERVYSSSRINPLCVIAWRVTGHYYYILRRPHCAQLGGCSSGCWAAASIVHAQDDLPGMDYSFSDMQHIHITKLAPKERRTLLLVAGNTIWTKPSGPKGRHRALMSCKEWIAAVLRHAASADVLRRELVEICVNPRRYTQGASRLQARRVDAPQAASVRAVQA
ncbi:hypothetical protein PsYK624_166180 [Phanerochaete sordida]|uniref:Uncharacterized protein n=1 Tax=Phanerochaete sordida TaxID=48140 RepID=A0A9P3LNU2_9APHY|nr:hypothetical protein PsYK624_166180 [Phanerochaete sordida]